MKEDLENLTLTGILRAREIDRQQTTYLMSLYEWMVEQWTRA